MDNKTLPIILQHVRELAEVNLGGTENPHFKIITPFPPVGNDFIDFTKEDLEFNDSPADADSAKMDTINAFDFFTCTNYLYYNYSYGIKSMEYFLSQVCKKFYGATITTDTTDSDFTKNYNEKKDAYLVRFKRSTAGDLGLIDFRYTSLSPIQWNNTKVVLEKQDIARLKEKAVAVYENIDKIDNEYIKTLIAEINAASYSRIEYELGFFDVLREWMDPQLFESNSWKFTSDIDALYGENDNDFTANDVKLCYVHRFYIIKSFSGTITTPPIKGTIVTHDHRDGNHGNRLTPNITVHDHRTLVRNIQLNKKLLQINSPQLTGAGVNMNINSRGKFIWVPARPSVPGHWERKKAIIPDKKEEDPIYKIAALIGRVIPWKPTATNVNAGIPAESL